MATAPVEYEPVIGNVEAEAALLSALMLSASLIDPVADMLTPEDFADPWCGNVFSLIVKERSLGRSPNPITLKPYLDAESYRTLCGLTGGSGAHAIVARDAAEQIRELAQRRRLLDGLKEAADGESVQDIAATAEAALAGLAEQETGAEELTAGQCGQKIIDRFDQQDEGGVRSGMASLDAVLGPLRPKSFNIVAGRPGMGKSATALSYAVGAARNGHGVLFISLEMAADEIGERLLADICFDTERRVPANAISSGNLSSEQKRELCRAHAMLDQLPLVVVDTSGARVGKIERLVRRYARRFAAKGQRLELVVVDYLGLARPDRERSKTYEEVSEVSQALKGIAKRHGIALMALHQLSRKVEERKDKRPNQADLRDSGQIEQDADSILFLYAPEYYLMAEEPALSDPNRDEWEAEMHKVAAELQFIVAKRRRGPAGVGRGHFYRAYQAVRG